MEVTVSRLIVFALTLSACGTTETYNIAAHKAPCVGVGLFLCSIVDSGEGDEYFYDGIDGFEFAWGTEVTAEVRKTKVVNPPADGSSSRYTLVEILDDEPVATGTEFSWDLQGGLNNMTDTPPIDPTTMTLLDGTAFACPDATLCDAVDQANEDGADLVVTFAFAADALELVAVE